MPGGFRNRLLWRGTAWGACLTGTLFAMVGYFTFEFPSPLSRSLEYELLYPIEAAFHLGFIGFWFGAFFGLFVGVILRGMRAAWILWTGPDDPH
jgi:hypothetical protein